MSAKKKDDIVKPQVIDLEAEAVTEIHDGNQDEGHEQQTQAEPESSRPTHQTSTRNTFRIAIPALALLAGTAAGGWLYRDYLSTYFPNDRVTELEQQITELRTRAADDKSAIQTLDTRATAGLAGLQDSFAKLQQQAAGKTQVAEFAARLGEIETRLASLASTVDEVRKAPAMSAAPGNTGDQTIIATLQQRITALETSVDALQAKSAATSPTTARLEALASLRNRINAGEPFETELSQVKVLMPSIAVPTALSDGAAKGIASTAALATELQQLVGSLPSTGTQEADSQDTSFWASIKNSLKSIVTIKTAGLTDWASLAAAAAALAADGRLRDAVDHLAAQSGPPAEISAWLDKAQQRLDADSDLTHITAAVMNLAVAP